MSTAHELLKAFVEAEPTYTVAPGHVEFCCYCDELKGSHKEDCLLVKASIEIAKSEGWVKLPEGAEQ